MTAYVAWRACVGQPYAGVDFIPPVRDYEFGYAMYAVRTVLGVN
jgi:hypothetical protein